MFPAKLPIISQPPSGADTTSFISTWGTAGASEANRTVTLPLVSSGSINFTIDWGDATAEETITAYDDADRIHIYAAEGTYTVTMGGTIRGFKFNNGGDKAKIKTITQWGTFDISTNNAFYGCSALDISATDAPTISSTDLESTFNGCDALSTNIGSLWDVSSVTSFSAIFLSCDNFNADISEWDVSSGTNFYGVFKSAPTFNQNIGSWDMSSATTTYRMFQAASAFNQDIGSWDVSSVTYMRQMLYGAAAFNQDISSWDVNQVTNFLYFIDTTSLSVANYNLLLHHWEADNPIDGLSFTALPITTDTTSGGVDGTAARARLISVHSWTITDGDS